MSHALALLQEWVQREEVARVPVFDVAERPVLTLLHIAVRNRHGHLDVGVEVMLPGDEVAFQLADSPDREPVPPEPEIDIEHVLQRGLVVQVHIDVPGEVDTGVGKVVLFLSPPLRDFLDFRSKRWHLQRIFASTSI